MSDPKYITHLKQTLFSFPASCDFRLRNDEKKLLRECLFRAVSHDSKYLGLLFPKLFGTQKNSGLQSGSQDFEWSFSDYDKLVGKFLSSRPRDINHRHMPCARIFRRGQPIYRCLTCGLDDTCALCYRCYQAEEHIGHVVHISICQRDNGGVCDCGDPEAWERYFVCKSSLLVAESSASETTSYIPKDLEHSFTATICVLLDYIIDVMCQSDSHLESMNTTEMNSDLDATGCHLDSSIYGYQTEDTVIQDRPSRSYSLLVYNDQIRHYHVAAEKIHQVSRKLREFAIMVTNQVQKDGRAIVIRSQNNQLLHDRQKLLSGSGLVSCIRNSKDEFRENMCQEIISWLIRLTESKFFRSSEVLRNALCYCFCCKWNPGISLTNRRIMSRYAKGKLDFLFRIPNIDCVSCFSLENVHWSFKPSIWDADVTLCEKCDYNLDPTSMHRTGLRGSRFQYFIYFDIRFWKSIRSDLHDLYLSSLITNFKYKKLFLCQYVDIYPVVADMFLNIDREPDNNIMPKLSSQLFTCPSHSTSIISHGDITRMLLSTFNYLRDGELTATTQITQKKQGLSLTSLKNRRWGQIFLDIGYVISHGNDKELIFIDSVVPMACDILSLFQGKPVLKREKEQHIEYESIEYTAFFNAVSVVYQFAEYISEAITNLEKSRRQSISKNAIDYVVAFLLTLETDKNHLIYRDQIEKDFGQRPELSSVNGFKEQESPKVSFLHPLHSLLSWLIEFSDFESIDQLNLVLCGAASRFLSVSPELKDREVLFNQIFGYAIQTVVVSSQIKSGFWVRNGFSVKSQLHLYRNTSLREQGYLRDLFLVQVFAACADVTTIITVILKKWLLFEWTVSAKECIYETSVLSHILEELLNFFVHVLTEDVFLRGLPRKTTAFYRIKTELIHNLCFGPCSYSMLCSQVPKHIISDKSFDSILDQLTWFKESKSSKNSGTFILKDEYFGEVDPYYFDYTINKKDDAINLLKRRIARSEGLHVCDVVISPKKRKHDVLSVYNYLANFTCSPLFTTVLTRIIDHIHREGATKLDGLLETVLHLIHICSTEEHVDSKQYSFFAQMFKTGVSDNSSLATRLYHILSREELKAHHSKIRAIFRTLGTRHQDLVSFMQKGLPMFELERFNVATDESYGQKENNRKKSIAQEKQAKLMEKLKKQRSSFSRKNNVNNDCNDVEMDDTNEKGWKFPQAHCILCQDATEGAGPFGIIAQVSKASVFRQVPFDDPYWFLKAFSDGANLNSMEKSQVSEKYSAKWKVYMEKAMEDNIVGPGFAQVTQSKSICSTCGHGMHFHCYMQYISSNGCRSNQITRNTLDSVDHTEFMCPLCKAISNMFIPILWASNNRSWSKFVYPCVFQKTSLDAVLKFDVHDVLAFSDFCDSTTKDLKEFSILTEPGHQMMSMLSIYSSSAGHDQRGQLLTNIFSTLSVSTFPDILKADCPKTLINTIKSVEISLRGVEANSGLVIRQISNNSLIILRALNEFRLSSLLVKLTNRTQPRSGQSDVHISQYLNFQNLGSDEFNHAIIHSDFFKILVTIFPSPSADLNFNSIMHSCFLGSILQVLNVLVSELVRRDYYVENEFDVLDVPFSDLITDSEASLALRLFKTRISGQPSIKEHEEFINDPIFGYILYSMMLKSLTPFLRQAAIYAYVCCGNVDSLHGIRRENYRFEADLLCSALQIPTLKEMLQRFSKDSTDESMRLSLFQTHIWNANQDAYTREPASSKMLDYPGIIKLVELPDRLDMFFTEYYYSERHVLPHLRIDNPAVCLVCADVVDMQRRAVGSPYGQCSMHLMTECIGSIGIFLLPKERRMLLLHRNGGTFYDAPYLDNNKEFPAEDKGEKALYLSKHVYNEFIKKFWLGHEIPNVIVRKLDNVIDAGGWDTL